MRLAAMVAVLALVACNRSGSGNATPPPVEVSADGVTAIESAGASLPAASGPIDFVWTDFHFELGGTAVLAVDGRSVRELFPDSRRTTYQGEPATEMFFRLATYELDDTEAEKLEKLTLDAAFWSLDARYKNDSIADGTTQTFTATVGSRTKHVSCYQNFPGPVQGIQRWIAAVREHHQDMRERAAEAEPKVAEAMRTDAAAAAKR